MPPNFDNEFDRDFLLPQLTNEDGNFDNFEYFEDFGNGGISNDDHDEEGIGDRNGVKFMYYDSTWNQDHFTYDPKHLEFREDSTPNIFWCHFPTFLHLFELFWLHSMYRKIVYKTNQYVMEKEK